LLPACADHIGPTESGEAVPTRHDAGNELALRDAGGTAASEQLDGAAQSAVDAGDALALSDARLAAPPPAESGVIDQALHADLAVPERWSLLDAAADPFTDRPAVVDCPTAGVTPEMLSDERVLGVETGWCNYLTATQPTLRAVSAGEEIKVRLWHFELFAADPAEAHAAVLVAGLPVLDERVPIPGPGGLIVRKIVAERAIPAGAPVYFHLHNHGANSWALVEVSAGPAAPN
jgi:hypothetical protein